MAGPVIYSTNSWLSHDIAMQLRGGKHYVWCSEYYDPSTAPAASAGTAIASSSTPRAIFETLKAACDTEDSNCFLIKNYRKKFKQLATGWLADATLTRVQYDELIAQLKAPSWRIWRPLLYVIPRHPIVAAGRLESVPRKERAAHGPELRIVDLASSEFDIIECQLR